ncbi:uro-adherence factor A-like [Montipora capricornis]|uniref:uro-adherence factor A-like n=1 Tax=Montipora capricornis TaxID=246305 RepID=UPI0035F15D53
MSSNRRASLALNSVRRSPRRRTKTPSVNDLSKKYKLSPRGKRKLEFQYDKPLKGKTFYLDLQGYRKISTLQAQIVELGGKVEEFLSKDIGCVVTNKKYVDARCSPRSNSTPSPILSVPSPIPGHTKSSSAKGSAVPSPLSADSGGAELTGLTAPKHKERGKALAAQAAVTCKYGSSNVIANASNWGVKIELLEDFLKKLEKYGSIEKKQASKPLLSGRATKHDVKPKVRKLYAPFIKVEDHSRGYRPLVHELKEWPRIYFDGPVGGCPFDPPRNDTHNDREEHGRHKRKQVQRDKTKKRGFCECCCIHYEDLDAHLLSERHQSFARDPFNYHSLDELIKKGPSLQDFLAKMLKKHEEKEREKQEKNSRDELPDPKESCLEHTEPKTPCGEVSSKCQRADEGDDCYTPPNPSPAKTDDFCTPTMQPTPDKTEDKNTSLRVSRSSKKAVQGRGSRRSLSSPRTPQALQVKSGVGKECTTPIRHEAKKMSSPLKIEDGVSKKQISRVKTRSISLSPAAGDSAGAKRASVISPRAKGASAVQGSNIDQSSSGGAIRSRVSPDLVNKRDAVDLPGGVRTRRSQQDSEESSGKDDHCFETAVNAERKVKCDSESQTRLSEFPPETTQREQQPHEKGCAEEEKQIETQSVIGEHHEHDKDQSSPRRASLRSATKTGPAVEARTPKSSVVEIETCAIREGPARGMRSPKTLMPAAGETKSDVKKDSEVSLNNQMVALETNKVEQPIRATRSCFQSGPILTPRVCDSIETKDPAPVTTESTAEETEPCQDKRRTSPRFSAASCKEDTPSSPEPTEKAAKNQNKQPSPNRFPHNVQVKLSDFCAMSALRNRPVLGKSSDDSETESIQLSTGENLSPSKEEASKKTTSEPEDEEISSTPTITCCPSSPGSVKSGFSNETGGRYCLRKRAEEQEEKEKKDDQMVSKPTRSNYKILDEEPKRASLPTTVAPSFTSVKAKISKEKSELLKGHENKTPEKKTRKSNRKMRSQLHTTPRRKVPRSQDPESDLESSVFSDSPRSGPIRETRSMRASVRSHEEAQLKGISMAAEGTPLSETPVSIEDISTTAVCGSPSQKPHPSRDSASGDFPKRSVSRGNQTSRGVACLFDSDEDDDEEFEGFHVPHFDKSYSSEGDLSYQINSIVENINCEDGDTIHGDVQNTTTREIYGNHNELENTELVSGQIKSSEANEMTRGEQRNEKILEKYEECKPQTRKRKSASQCKSSNVSAKRAKSESMDEERCSVASYIVMSPVIDSSDDVDDDVFNTVSDSTDGEEEGTESPLSITSWRQKRKSEDLQPDVDRPTKRRKSSLLCSDSQIVTEPFSLNSKTGFFPNCEMGRAIEEKEDNMGEPKSESSRLDEILEEEESSREQTFSSSQGSNMVNSAATESENFSSRFDEMLEKTNRGQCFSSTPAYSEFYNVDEPVVQTMEERVKLRRKRSVSLKARENLSSVESQENDTESVSKLSSSSQQSTSSSKKALLPLKPLKRLAPLSVATKKDNLPLKPLRRVSGIGAPSQTFLPLKPLQHISPTQVSLRPSRVNSLPSFNQSPLVTPGKTRRPTWIFDLSNFGSPPSEMPDFDYKGSRCSTSTSAKPKYTLRSQKRASWNLKQKDIFAFDEY